MEMTRLPMNIGPVERIFSALGGSYLLFDIIFKKQISPVKTITASYLLLRGATGFCLAYQALGKTEVDYRGQNVNIKTTLTVSRPRHQVYAFWRTLENLPQFMAHLKSVKVINEKISEWEAKVPGGLGTVTWQSEIVKDDPGAFLSWQSLPGSTIENAGKIEFNDAGDSGTELNVVFSYHAPLGILGEKTAQLLNPVFEKMVRADIENFKRSIETGDILVIDTPVSGKNS